MGGSHCCSLNARCSPKIKLADFAIEIFKQANKEVIINRVTTEEYGVFIAKRPHNSRLDKSKLLDNGFKPLPDRRDALRRYLKEINNNNN